MKQCNLPITRECLARPCMNCVPTDEADWLDEVDTPDPERERQEVLEIAEMFGCEFLFEQPNPVQLPQSPNARDPFPQSSELTEWWTNKYSQLPYSAEPPVYVKGQGFIKD